MAEEYLENSAQFMDGSLDDAFVPPSLKFDFIYQYMSNIDWKYLAQIPNYKQPAYQLKRLWLLLANGFVPEWHNNFIPTKLGNTIINTIKTATIASIIKLFVSKPGLASPSSKRFNILYYFS